MKRSIVWVILPMFCLFLLPCTASAQDPVVPGQINPQVTGTAGIDTGLVEIRSGEVTNIRPADAHIDWGDGSPQDAAQMDCIPGVAKSTCDYWGEHKYASSGTYTVTVTAGIPDPLFPIPVTKVYKATAQIDPVGNFVILSIGDSVASGEGNPVVPARSYILHPLYNHPAYWSVDPTMGCSDRSSLAGPVLAAKELQEANPNTRITMLHLACSGFNISQAINQLKHAVGYLPSGTTIDALFVTVGADDIDNGFGNVVMTCLLYTWDCSTSLQPPAETMRESLEQINGSEADSKDLFESLENEKTGTLSYSDLRTEIANPVDTHSNGQGDTIADTYITGYFDPTRDGTGNFPNLFEAGICDANLLLPDELSYLYSNFVVPLNSRISHVADNNGWHYVGGIAEDFLTHGYCAGRDGQPGISWVVSTPQSFALQGNPNGTSHPNSLGQADYATRLVQAVNQYTSPTTVATATSAGKPYMFGTWATHDVEVSFKATNKLATAGVGQTYFSEDDSTCSDASPQSCLAYQGPFTMDQAGKHTLYFLSSNKSGTFEKQQTEQVWIDNAPPVMNCYATPSVLWAPNHKLVPVNLDVTAVSAAFGPTPFTLTSVTTSEGNPATDIQGFTLGKPSTQGWLRASRTGTQRAGRVYTFTYKSTDPLGLTGSCATTVTVPHDHGRR